MGFYVAPLVGAWIEIGINSTIYKSVDVAPLVGAWIEMFEMDSLEELEKVAPLVGAWIEIRTKSLFAAADVSLPSWERGLK